MTLETWWLYLGAVVLIACTPGPNVLYVTTRSIRFGLGPAFIGVAGCLTALVLMLTGSVAGLSALLLALPGAFDVLKIAGAAYLVYLGIQVWREPIAADAPPPSTGTSGVALFRGGFLVGISNPKLLVFAAAFFPQFIDPARAWGSQFALMVATFLGVELFFYSVYALTGRKLADRLMHGIWRRWLNRASGAVFVGFGVALLRFKP
ncbi:LysE family translocator [Reyranella sp.]|jgi:threonine/homoserine/homoserine lactone efflux protein|uniref:LysE family translocator n=1 Tax=Reyranella sp. TaxID=1929291 RepID=UPI000BD2923F|nr:LysE family translocator [Reyranella sp.]OYY43119.1 MAG: amino acid transporter [Rhodospirillales bacterium 35-66-84]OYZ95088.1 MAG: amino acid transporter [Rhodospirillales bacterium 24-66-33]OZB26528.1 MAG: amino acid transporter [Rhodospirillales bacterium 39-66-50]HQS15943.1 LysE family translocator [Reyranella sp.]HQT13209.1 LysE family translocator [Reyranella sp.]